MPLIKMKSIGYFANDSQDRQQKYDVPRQAILNPKVGTVHLEPGQNFEQALEDLSRFSHIWLIYLFDNESWKPKVQSPRDLNKRGVFATRSPYRPNPIGMSCVELIKVKGLKLSIKNFDLLNDTKILDIKPYIAYSDKMDLSKKGWLSDLRKYQLHFSDQFYLDLVKYFPKTPSRLVQFITEQLSYAPIKHPSKRVKSAETQGQFVLAYKYYRIHFNLLDRSIEVISISLSEEQNKERA